MNFRSALGIACSVFAAVAVSCSKMTSSSSTSGVLTCSSQSSSPSCSFSDPAPNGTFMALAGANVMSVTVNSANIDGYINLPMVSVQICTPGTATCQTIGNILLDTGSYGLRIFKSAISGPESTQYTIAGHPIAECTEFGSANTWGSVQLFDVKLDGQTLSNFPIQQIDSTFQGGPPATTVCGEAGSVGSPAGAGFNGILGVGLGTIDCPECTTIAPMAGGYFSCAGVNNCTPVTVAAANQVQNPVPNLTTDNNGVLLELPSVGMSGSVSGNGYLAFGIGTQANNKPSSWRISNVYHADGNLTMRTVYNGQTMPSFIDSGSEILFFPDCFSAMGGLFAPGCNVNLSATNQSYGTATSGIVSFMLADPSNLSGTAFAFNNIGGPTLALLANQFDWGLPFFFGRTVFVGVGGKSAAGGELGGATGPYWAY